MRIVTLFTALSSTLVCVPQTGPGGVGNAASNVLWLCADRGVTTTGTAVTNWADQSGNGNHATAPSVGARPTLVASSLNGYPTISFDGTSDELRIPDAASLDLTQWDMFMVSAESAPVNNNCWFAKGVSTTPNYGLWSPSTGAMQLPIFDILGLLSSPPTPVGTTGATHRVIEYSNRVLFIFFPSRNVYRNGTNVYTDASLLQLPATNNNPLVIGNTQDATGWFLNGVMAETIVYNNALNNAQRIIVSNYLAAKYGRTLTASDLYVQDLPGNGDYDHEVAGIGRVNSSNLHNDARGSGIVRISKGALAGLGDDEFMLWGHDNNILGSFGSTDYPPGLQGRLHRVWRVSEVNNAGAAVDVGNVNMTWDLAGLGPVTATDLRLLVDTDNDGIFADETPIAGAVAAGGTLYTFSNVSALVNPRRFTLGTINIINTPLPIELLSFSGRALSATSAVLEWVTATEHDNDFFTVERSKDGAEWTEVGSLDGAGNSSSVLHYSLEDHDAPGGLVFYRLRQTDMDGTSTCSDVVAIQFPEGSATDLTVYPNPSDGPIVVLLPEAVNDAATFMLIDASGRALPLGVWSVAPGNYRVDPGTIAPGTYVLRVQGADDQAAYSVRIVR